MVTRLGLDARLDLTVDAPDLGQVSATVRAAGSRVDVTSDHLAAFSAHATPRRSRELARELARVGLTVALRDSAGVVVTMGAVRTRLVDRVLTRSRHIRVGRFREARALSRRSGPAVLDLAAPPPGTPWPPIPTIRSPRRRVTTTHDPSGGGSPRLYLADASDPAQPGPLGVFLLPRGVTRIGSGDDADLRLAGVDDLQAEIVRTEDDEYVLVARSTQILSTVGGRQLPRQVLRTGARIQLGPWRMSYVRDEHADHGRPYGGRIGGELGRQRPQPRPANRRDRPGF